ncbi:hypothetical protein EON80_23190 [bacterium]|nr:MAG: hypothetical protein EON80_23190 [bacterium]
METVLDDRNKRNHQRAFKSATDLVKLSRIVRREGYNTIDSMVGSSCEGIALTSAAPYLPRPTIRSPRPGAALAQYQAYPRSLYAYAKEQGRSDLFPLLNWEWKERNAWDAAFTKLFASSWNLYSPQDALLISVAERYRALALKTIPSVLFGAIIFGLLAYRFRDRTPVPNTLWPGFRSGVWLLTGLLLCDAIMAFNTYYNGLDWKQPYISNTSGGLLERAPSWSTWGLAVALICLAVHRVVVWQKQQSGKAKGFVRQLKTLFAPPEDGLAPFDFGWLFGLVVRCTVWLLSLGALLWYCGEINEENQSFAWCIPVFGMLISLAAHAWAWKKELRRRQTALLAIRSVSLMMAGFFVFASITYTMVAFAVLSKAYEFESKFDQSIQTGELKLIRQKMKL